MAPSSRRSHRHRRPRTRTLTTGAFVVGGGGDIVVLLSIAAAATAALLLPPFADASPLPAAALVLRQQRQPPSSSGGRRRRRRPDSVSTPPPPPRRQRRRSSSSGSGITTTNSNTNNNKISSQALIHTLQSDCHTPSLVLSRVGRHLTPRTDPDGRVSSLVLVRLAKMLVERTNCYLYGNGDDGGGGGDNGSGAGRRSLPSDKKLPNGDSLLSDDDDDDGVIGGGENDDGPAAVRALSGACQTLAVAIRRSSSSSRYVDLDVGVEGVKAAGVLSRLLYPTQHQPLTQLANADASSISGEGMFGPIAQAYSNISPELMDPHHLSGLRWAYDSLSLLVPCSGDGDEYSVFDLPSQLSDAYQSLNLPFRIRPGFFLGICNVDGLTVPALRSEVDFRAETLRTTSTGESVAERRLTAWQGEAGVPGFAYSGKVMETLPFTPTVRAARDELGKRSGAHYDCCLLNLYPDGDSGMRYHVDPDQGSLWGYETAVVSVGAARRFAFRTIPGGGGGGKNDRPHNFVVMDGDVAVMFDDCQTRFQHSIKTAEGRGETTTAAAPRSSLVFKQSLARRRLEDKA